MNVFVATHSGLRWIVLILLVVAIINAVAKKNKNSYTKNDRLINLFAMIMFHIQILLGIVLYLFNHVGMGGRISYSEGWMKNPMYRFFGMEHIIIMVLAMIFVTIGNKKSKTKEFAAQKHGAIITFYLITLILVLAGIPWPFRGLGTGWF